MIPAYRIRRNGEELRSGESPDAGHLATRQQLVVQSSRGCPVADGTVGVHRSKCQKSPAELSGWGVIPYVDMWTDSGSVYAKIGGAERSIRMSAGRKAKPRRNRANKRCQICGIPMIDRSNNPDGYDRVLPGRMIHDHCAIDTPQVLSYCRGAIVKFGVVGVASSHRFWGLVQCSWDFSGSLLPVEVAR
jgi:hypothetical protein